MPSTAVWLFPERGRCGPPGYWHTDYILYEQYSDCSPVPLQIGARAPYSPLVSGSKWLVACESVLLHHIR